MQKFFPWSLRKVIEKVGGESLNISDDLLAFRQQRMSSSQRISPHFVLGENCSPVCICYKLLPQLNFLTFQFYSLGFFLRSFWATPQLHVHFTTCCYQLKIDPKSFFWMHFFALCYRRKRKMRSTHSVWKSPKMTHLQITMSIFSAIEFVLTVTVLSFRLISCPFLSYREIIQFARIPTCWKINLKGDFLGDFQTLCISC